MSGNIVSRIDEMGKRIDDVENSINDLMNDLGVTYIKKINECN